MRICSLLPSTTEIVYALGLGDRLVAVTHECDYPPEAASLRAVTRSAIDHAGISSREIHSHVSRSVHSGSSIYHLDQELLNEMDPDLILTQELCEVCAVSYTEVRKAVRILEGDRSILSLESTSLGGILESIAEVAHAAGVAATGAEVVGGLQERIDLVASRAQGASTRPRVFAVEWLDPLFIGGHWVPEMVRLAGGTDGLGREGQHSTVVSWEQVAEYDPEIVALMPCGFNLERNLEETGRSAFPESWRGLKAVRAGQVYAVDGSAYFNRPGPRIVDGLEILAEIVHPEIFPRTKPPEAWRRLDTV